MSEATVGISQGTAVPSVVTIGLVAVPIGNTSIQGKKIKACCYDCQKHTPTVEFVYEAFVRKELLRKCPNFGENCEILKNPKLFDKVFGRHHVIDWYYILRGLNFIRCWYLTREGEIRSYFLMLTEKISDDKITVMWA